MAKRVLIVHTSGGMGHITAAKAVEEAFKIAHPEIETANIDAVDYANKLYRKIFVDGYNAVSAKWPEIWGKLYRGFDNPKRHKLAVSLSQLAIESRLLPFIKSFNPDFVVCTHPLPAHLLAYAEERHLTDIPSVMVVTDYWCHSFWVEKEINHYSVPTADVGNCLQQYNVLPEQILITGIPIAPKFSQGRLNTSEIRKKLGIPAGAPVLLIVGGQFSFDDLQRILSEVSKPHPEAHFLVVAGRDKELKAALDSSKLGSADSISTFGFVDNMEELMSAADLIFSKAGGLTVSECMAMGLPMVINKVIPGQEQDNVDFLTRNGAAIHAQGIEGIISTVNQLLVDRDALAKMSVAAKAIGKPRSAFDLVDFVYQQIV